MIFESGMHIHFDKVKRVGLSAMGVAVLGTVLPLAIGLLLERFRGVADTVRRQDPIVRNLLSALERRHTSFLSKEARFPLASLCKVINKGKLIV